MIPRNFLPLLCALALCLPATSAAAQEAASGRQLDRAVDTAVDALRRQQVPEEGCFPDRSAATAGRFLVALARCHRAYTIADGPMVRWARDFLFRSRTHEGAFQGEGDPEPVEPTRWAAEALLEIEPGGSEEAATALRFLARRGVEGPLAGRPFREETLGLARTVHEKGQDALAGRIQKALGGAGRDGLVRGADGSVDARASVERLVALVALQTLARRGASDLVQGAPEEGIEAAEEPPAFEAFRQRALDFLLEHQKDGVWHVQTAVGPVPDIGVTSLCLAALLTKPGELRTEREKEILEKGLAAVVASQHEDGAFGESYANYTTCAAVMALAMADREEYGPLLQRAQRYLMAIQHAEDMGYHPSDRDFGSFGYGGSQRGDLNNTQMAMEALRTTGLPPDHEVFRKALVFLSRTQNLRGAHEFPTTIRDPETGEWRRVVTGDDGGAPYYPGNSPMGYDRIPDGSLVARSYGSMTFGLLKAYILAGLSPDDPRVEAARRWIEHNFTVDENPGASPDLDESARYQGLFFYYLTMARALTLLGEKTLRDQKGEERDWRAELRGAFQRLQGPDGAWINDRSRRWWEGNAVLCTAYALLALYDMDQL